MSASGGDIALKIGSSASLAGSITSEAGASGSSNATEDATFVVGVSQSLNGGSMTIEAGDEPNQGRAVTISADSSP